jgi:trehalose/maltose transport system permease protein
MTRSGRRIQRTIILSVFCAAVVLFAAFPFYWSIVSSLKTGTSLFKVELWPREASIENYISVFREQPFARNIANSAIVSSLAVVISLMLGLLGAYALGRLRFRGRKAVLLLILGVSMFPQITALAGMFELVRALGLYNSLSGLVVSYLVFTMPFTIWILAAFIQQLPRELEEAAILDGASAFVILRRIFLPLLGPAVVTAALLAFIHTWNEFLFALTFTLSNYARTIPVAITLMSGSTEHELPWGVIMAASVVVTAPLVILVLIFQRRIVSGLTAGAIKG